MNKKNRKPAIRFKAFNDPWEQRKLGNEATEVIAGGDVDKTSILSKGKFPVIANALSNDGIIGYYENEFRVKAPAVTVTGRGDVGHAKARESDFTPVVRLLSIKTKHNIHFLENAINTLHIVIESTGVPQLTVPQLSQYELSFPKKLEEELRIGAFFRTLDIVITLHQHKLDKLQNVKKACLEKMFPQNGESVPRIRFKGFTDTWEQREFRGFVKRASEQAISNTQLPGLEYEDLISETGQLNKDISKKKSNKKGLLFDKGDILFGKLRPYLKNWLLADFSGVAIGDFWVLRPENVDNGFIYFLIQTPAFSLISNISSGSKMPRSDWGYVSSATFKLPRNKTEQVKIGNLFQQVDSLITLHQRKLDMLKNLKKACLEKMFV